MTLPSPVGPHLHLIVNARSGSAEMKARVEELPGLFAAAGEEAHIHLAESGDAISELTRRALADGARTVVACGGDGTVAAVASLLVDTDTRLGVLPMGTFNYFVRGLGIPLDLPAAVRTVVEGNTVRVDVGDVNGRIFLNNTSLGLYSEILRDRERVYARFGRSQLAAYLSVAFALARPSRFLTMRMVVDGRETFRRTPLLFVANNGFQIEAFRLRGAPCMKDGAFAIYVTHPLGQARMILLAIRTLMGALRTSHDLDVLCAHEMWIETSRPRLRIAADGELVVLQTPLHIRVRREALTVLAPAAGNAVAVPTAVQG